jgi:hypothetical protein
LRQGRDIHQNQNHSASPAQLEQDDTFFALWKNSTFTHPFVLREQNVTRIASTFLQPITLTNAAGTNNEITETVINEELTCAAMGWNSCWWKRKPPTGRKHSAEGLLVIENLPRNAVPRTKRRFERRPPKSELCINSKSHCNSTKLTTVQKK